MYDSVNISSVPADATDLLCYSDGLYANISEAKARFPAARIHTISAVGAVPAEWIDVEEGCVWPPNRAVDLWHSWLRFGCKGFYCSISLQPTLRSLLAPGDNPEWFDANYTGVDHVDPGDVATQWADPGPYDISETTPAFEGATPAPTPAPTPPTEEQDMAFPEIWHDATEQIVVFGDGGWMHVPTPADGSALEASPALVYREVPSDLIAALKARKPNGV